MKIPISILEKQLPEYKAMLNVYKSVNKRPNTNYYKSRIKETEQIIASIEMAIEILLNHSK